MKYIVVLLMLGVSSFALSADSDSCFASDGKGYSLVIKVVGSDGKREDYTNQTSGCEFELRSGETRTYADVVKKSVDGNVTTSYLSKSYFVGNEFSGTGIVSNDGVSMDFNMNLTLDEGGAGGGTTPPTLKTFNKHENLFLAFGEESSFDLGLNKVYLTVEPY